jgi:hypothetical protein
MTNKNRALETKGADHGKPGKRWRRIPQREVGSLRHEDIREIASTDDYPRGARKEWVHGRELPKRCKWSFCDGEVREGQPENYCARKIAISPWKPPRGVDGQKHIQEKTWELGS